MSYCGRTGEKNCKCFDPIKPMSAKQIDLNQTLRKLFSDHGVYTAFVLKSIVDHQPDTKVFLTRLLANQKDIGDQLKPILGAKASALLTKVLTEHIQLAGAVITAATNKDKTLNQKIEALFRNSDEVAKVLTSVNPELLPLNVTSDMFHKHNEYVISMTQYRIAKKYKKEQETYDSYYNELLMMADAIYNAI